MGKTVFNPITTKWRGAIGGFRYSVCRGKQIIAERASAVRNPNTSAQVKVRNNFKLATQFSNAWKDFIALFLADKNMDLVETRAMGTKVAYSATVGNAESAELRLPEFAAKMNAKFMRQSSTVTVTFTSAVQTIATTEDTEVIYQVLAFDDLGNIVGKSVQSTNILPATPATIVLPVTRETPDRYDLMVFETKATSEDGYGAISEILGEYNGEVVTNYYSNYREVLSNEGVEICSIIAASTLAS